MGVNVDHEVIAKFTGEVGKHGDTYLGLEFFLSNLRVSCWSLNC
jgi:hypothetical protein